MVEMMRTQTHYNFLMLDSYVFFSFGSTFFISPFLFRHTQNYFVTQTQYSWIPWCACCISQFDFFVN